MKLISHICVYVFIREAYFQRVTHLCVSVKQCLKVNGKRGKPGRYRDCSGGRVYGLQRWAEQTWAATSLMVAFMADFEDATDIYVPAKWMQS